MSINPLNDISKVYLEQVSVASRVKNAVADDRLDAEQEKTNASMNKLRQQNKRFDRALASDAARKVERDVKKSNAYGPQRPKPGTVTGRRIEEPKPTGSKPKGYRVEEIEIDEAVKGADPEMRKAASDERRTGDKRLSPSKGKGYADQQKQQISYMDKLTKKNKNVVGLVTKEALDPVGQEDADIDNDGDTDKSDKYLHKRRKAIGKAIAKKNVKEGYSNWRSDLIEVMDVIDKKEKNDDKIVEKKVNNKIKINPTIGEAVKNLGGTLLEMVEVDEVDFIIESAYEELLSEGYEEDDIEEALEYALTEATVTYGHDTPTGEKKRGNLVKAVGRLARQKLSSKVRGAKASAKAAVARGARKVAKGALGVARKMEGGDKAPKATERKPSTYRGAGAGTKEKVSSGSYTPPAKKKAEKPADPWEGTASTPPKSKPKAATKKAAAPKAKAPAAPKRKRKSKLDDLLADIRSESVQQIDEMPYQVMGSPDGGKEKKIGKPVKSRKYADARAAELADTHKTTGGKYRSQYVEEIGIDEDAGIVSGLVGLALGAKGAYNAAKKSKRMRDYPKNFVKGVVDPRTYVPQKKREQKEEFQIDEKTLTKMEMKKREELVKSMKDKASDFEKRYPGRGKEVMYATATKMAKKMVEQMVPTEPPTSEPAIDKKKEMLDKQKLANMKILQQKQQMLKKRELEMKKAGKLPLEAN